MKPSLLAPTLACFGAFLLFFLQPLTGQQLTPKMGGNPYGWLLVMLWFQSCLFLGNLMALILTRLPLKVHLITLVALVLPLPFLPTLEVNQVEGLSDVATFLLGSLWYLPVVLGGITATSARYITTFGESSSRVFVYSNIGSFAGLVGSIVLELFGSISLGIQLIQISIFGLLIVLGSVFFAMPSRTTTTQQVSHGAWRGFLPVFCYAALGCALLNTLTSKLTMDLGSAPFIWVPPLMLFLLSYVLAFSILPKFINNMRDVGITAVGAFVIIPLIGGVSNFGHFTAYLIVFLCILCSLHTLLAAHRPECANHQAMFTTAMSIGGIFGSSITAILFPLLFSINIDLPIILSVIAISLVRNWNTKPTKQENIWGVALIAAILVLAVTPTDYKPFVLLLFLVYSFILSNRVFCIASIIFLIGTHSNQFRDLTEAQRNMFGTKYILSHIRGDTESRTLKHGTTTHGEQLLISGVPQREPLSYYSKEGPLGELLNPGNKVLIVGLGIGSISGYENLAITYIEIDPQIAELAKQHFTYLQEEDKIIIGDGRIETGKLDEQFDVIIIDAFSSDSIPYHLITVEALQEYLRVLNPDGILALHISNRYYDLERLIVNNANFLGKKAQVRHDYGDNKRMASKWSIITKKDSVNLDGWNILEPKNNIWTDNKGSLLWLIR